MDILILGGSGQLGQTVYRELKNNFQTISFSKSQLSITNKKELRNAISKFRPKFIINCSAYTKVELAETEIEKANAVNHIGIKNICEIAQLNNIGLIHFSTDYVFDGKKQSSYLEEDKAAPINEYGTSKLKGENHIIKNCDKFFIFRVSGIFSEYGDNFVKAMMRLKDRDELSVVSDQIMKPSSASFIAKFISINLLKNNFTLPNVGLYHLASSGLGISWFNFAKLIFQEMVEQKLIMQSPKISPILSENYESSVIRPKFSVLSNDKVKEKFILLHGDYRKNLAEELNRIYQSL
tara:strand:- start:1039 stop:1920 length:882 start_codon:yes stop_codon:yes gene_type:complete